MTETEDKIEQIARLSYGRLVAILASRVESVSAAEDALSDALVRALEVWPQKGLPDNPDAWLLTTARNRAIDRARNDGLVQKYRTELDVLHQSRESVGLAACADPRLRLMFACAHPAIDPAMRAPLMLQTVLGLDARRLASVYLVSPGAMGQRLTRAKAKIEQSGIPLTMPDASDEFDERLSDILAAIYAAYGVGYNSDGTQDQKAANLAREALWLISTVCAALPNAAEAHGLFSLILFTQARQPARVDRESGKFVPLHDQNPALWNAEMLTDAEQALMNARRNLTLGRFQMEASIQAVHAARRNTGTTDWDELRLLYKGLVQVAPTIGAMTGQAAVQAEAVGPTDALRMLDEIDPVLRGSYQPWYATRAHILMKLRRYDAAVDAFDAAIGLSDDPASRAYLVEQRARIVC